jgi:putative transposase
MGKKMARDQLDPAAAPFEVNFPFELLQLDHALVDLILVDQTFRRPIGRPWLTIAIDCHTRTVAGIHLGLERPSAVSVAACITHAYLPKDGWLKSVGVDSSWPGWGSWNGLHLDNAREFHSDALKAGCSVNQIIIDYRPVATPHYGAYIERLIGTFSKQIHLLSGTTFSSPKERGQYRSEDRATMTFPEFLRWFVLEVQSYHNRPHSGLDGLTPMQAWINSLSTSGALTLPSIIPDPRRFILDFLPFTQRSVSRDGVQMFGTRYFSPALSGYIGQEGELTVKFDTRDISKIYLQQPTGGYIDIPYADLRRPSVSLAEHKFVRRQLRKEGRDPNNESLVFDAIEKQRAITESAAKESKLARRAHETRKIRSCPPATLIPSEQSLDLTIDQHSTDREVAKLAFEEWA